MNNKFNFREMICGALVLGLISCGALGIIFIRELKQLLSWMPTTDRQVTEMIMTYSVGFIAYIIFYYNKHK